jgi:hypothetical protein
MFFGPVIAFASPLRRLRDQPVDDAGSSPVDELVAAGS